MLTSELDHAEDRARPNRRPSSRQLTASEVRLAAMAHAGPSVLSPGDAMHLQRAAGNRAVASLFGDPTRAREATAGGGEPDQDRIDQLPRTRAVQVTAVFEKGSSTPRIHLGRYSPSPGTITARQAVGPTGSPTVHRGGGNDCTPGTEVLDWTVVDAGANWRADVVALRVSGDIHITDWPSAPSSMTVPNTANPVDGGNINNTAGSPNHWQTAIDDMADYDTSGSGGAGPNWHSTAASSAHEWAHWNEDYLRDCIPSAGWGQTNTDIDAMTVPKAANPTEADGRAALAPLVTARFNNFVSAATRRWNTIITTTDRPGAGGRGYAAGMRVLNGLIAAVRRYAASKGWSTVTATGMSTTERTLVGAGTGALIGGGIGFLLGGPVGAAVGAGVGGLIGGIVGFFS